MNANVYNIKGEKAGTVDLPENVFGVKFNADLVHQVVVSMESNARTNTAHAKGRGEVSGGGKKPWRQKGTGRARHGSTRSPIWKGGGVTHGPLNERNYTKKVNKKERAKALYSVLSQKLKDGELIFVDSLSFKAPKTAEAKNVIKALSGVDTYKTLATKKKNTAFIGLGEKNEAALKSFKNFGNIKIDDVKNLNPVDAMTYKYIIITQPKESIEFLAGRIK